MKRKISIALIMATLLVSIPLAIGVSAMDPQDTCIANKEDGYIIGSECDADKSCLILWDTNMVEWEWVCKNNNPLHYLSGCNGYLHSTKKDGCC